MTANSEGQSEMKARRDYQEASYQDGGIVRSATIIL